MKAASQIITSLASLATALIFGLIFSMAFWQVEHRTQALFKGKPLPAATQFLIDHNAWIPFLALVPCVWLVGAPLLTRNTRRDYWDPAAFILRYLTFLSCEGLLFSVLLVFLLLPWVTVYSVLQSR